MKVLAVLFLAFGISLLACYLITGDPHLILCGNIATCAMFVFTGIAHFPYAKGMEMMIPQFLPYRLAAVYVTGVIEILAGIAVLYAPCRYEVSIGLVIFLIVIFPANIYTAIRHVDFTKANYEGNGPTYLFFRIPMQIFLIAWVWYFGIMPYMN